MDRRREPGYGRGPPPPPPRGPPMFDGPPRDRDMRHSPPRDYGRDMDRRRPRSPSPPFDRYGRGRSPPRDDKRMRRDFDPYPRGSPEFRRGSPPPPRYDDRDFERRESGRMSSERDDMRRLMTFKEFMLKRVPDEVGPDDAQRMYQDYLVEYYGSAIKAEFEQHKDTEFLRSQFDPRHFERLLAKKTEEAKDTANELVVDITSGKVDPKHDNFNQGMYDLAPKADVKPANPEEGPRYAPALCWKASRVAVDLALSRRLIRKLDAEKGIQENPLVPPPQHQPDQQPAEQAGGEDDGEKKEGSVAPEDAAAAKLAPVAEAEEAVVVDDSNLAESIAKLDMQLTWLWRVHGIDYYSGHELVEAEWPYRLTACRLIRGPCPEDGEQGDHASQATDAEELGRIVDDTWARRIAEGDPVEARCMRKRVEEEVDKWVDSQVTMIAENKWGSKLSNKMFVGRKYVVKHIRLKHEDKVLVEKERIYDELYFDNFRVAREEEKRRQEEEAAAAAAEMEGMGGEGMHGMGGDGMVDGPVMFGPGRGMRGRGMRGRGGMMRGGRVGPMMLGRGMMDAPLIVPMPAAMAPMMGPMIVPAPGPFMPILPGPIPVGPMTVRGGRGRVGPMGRGGRGGPMGGRGGPQGFKEYYDLDAPANNRAVLDYGDL